MSHAASRERACVRVRASAWSSAVACASRCEQQEAAVLAAAARRWRASSDCSSSGATTEVQQHAQLRQQKMPLEGRAPVASAGRCTAPAWRLPAPTALRWTACSACSPQRPARPDARNSQAWTFASEIFAGARVAPQLHHRFPQRRAPSPSAAASSSAAAPPPPPPRPPQQQQQQQHRHLVAAPLLAALQQQQDHGEWHHGVHYVRMEVRDYELDQFAVVNNACYASYVQHGRHKALASLGLAVEAFQARGTLMALSDLALGYRAPLRAGDVFVVTTAIAAVTAARVVIEHAVLQLPGTDGTGGGAAAAAAAAQRAPVLACSGQATVVFLDAAYRPVRVPADIRGTLGALCAERAAHAAAQ